MDAFSKRWGNELFSPNFCLDGFLVVAVMGKRPCELLSPQGKFSLSHGDPWVTSLDRAAGFLSKQNLELQVGISSLPSYMPQIPLSLHLYTYFSSNKNASLSHISFLSHSSDPMSSLSETVPDYFSPKEWPLVWPLLPHMALSLDAPCLYLFPYPYSQFPSIGPLVYWMITIRRKVKNWGFFEHRKSIYRFILLLGVNLSHIGFAETIRTSSNGGQKWVA